MVKMLSNIHHVQITIPVGKENAARDFYCKILGLKEILNRKVYLAEVDYGYY